MKNLKTAIINKLNKCGYDMRRWNKYNKYGWLMVYVYGKLRNVHKIEYHYDKYSMIIDDVEYSTVR